MTSLPASIEAALVESGFSATELMILKRLLEDDAMTLRQLALKTGKSTGVLDQAMKKLVKKGIVSKEDINGTPKYTIGSLQAITRWMEKDVKQKRDLLLRKFENFESFISSLEMEKGRPEMKHFHGAEGVRQAYFELLQKGKEFLQYAPVNYKEEEHPLRDFYVQYFRERRRRNIFARVLAPDTPLGRRFKSRDVFEFRETKLVPNLPISFEKIIVGDVVACFDHEKMSACFIQYPALAEAEIDLFNANFKQLSAPVAIQVQENPENSPTIPAKTRFFSNFRNFFLSRSSLITFGLYGLLSGLITLALYGNYLSINLQRLKEKAASIAATGALQFSPAEMEEIYAIEDMKKPAYNLIVSKLVAIRGQNQNIKFVYLMRPNNKTHWQFIADADTPYPLQMRDLNFDGVIDESDALSPPGSLYDVTGSEPSVDFSLKTTTSFEPFTDQWGTWISAWSPIMNNFSEADAILGIDIYADEAYRLTKETLAPIYIFIVSFFMFVLIRLGTIKRFIF